MKRCNHVTTTLSPTQLQDFPPPSPDIFLPRKHDHAYQSPFPKMSAFTVRPAGTDKDPFRVRLTAVSMLSLKLKSGDAVELITNDGGKGKRKLAIAWEGGLGPGMKDTIVQTSKPLQEAYGLRLGDKISLSRTRGIDEAGRVVVRKVGGLIDEEGVRYWSKHLAGTVGLVGEYVVASQRLRASEVVEFVVEDAGVHDALIAKVSPTTTFHIVTDDPSSSSSEPATPIIRLKPKRLGGIEAQINQIQGLVDDVCNPLVKRHFRAYEPVRGILLYGAKGTGKTALIEALTDSGWPAVTAWKPGLQIVPSPEPHLIVVDAEYLTRSASGGSGSGGPTSTTATKELQALFRGIRGTPTLVIGETRHPNDVDERLRAEGKFAVEIELAVPSAPQRKEILLAMRTQDLIPSDELVREMAERTHGYVGADLETLLRVALYTASKRINMHVPTLLNGHEEGKGEKEGEEAATTDTPITSSLQVTTPDLDLALSQTRPSALQEIFLETPSVHWSDIGGHHAIKQNLHNAISRPLLHAARMSKLRLKPKKGVLLYGPPGCSKTLLVRALATEAGLNFLAIKGAELISMYVGESERATREVFRKARQASPSIIFFDEIDAIASRGRSGSDLNVLTTLLNEMDGFEELRNVFVVAATNKPQQIDPALLRPGRFDNVVYIGPPDLEARREIFKKQLDGGLYVAENGLDVETDFDIDIVGFASATEGFSGAEIVAICQTAGELAFDEERETICGKDVREAIARTPRSITAEMLGEFEAWNAARMAR